MEERWKDEGYNDGKEGKGRGVERLGVTRGTGMKRRVREEG